MCKERSARRCSHVAIVYRTNTMIIIKFLFCFILRFLVAENVTLRTDNHCRPHDVVQSANYVSKLTFYSLKVTTFFIWHLSSSPPSSYHCHHHNYHHYHYHYHRHIHNHHGRRQYMQQGLCL